MKEIAPIPPCCTTHLNNYLFSDNPLYLKNELEESLLGAE